MPKTAGVTLCLPFAKVQQIMAITVPYGLELGRDDDARDAAADAIPNPSAGKMKIYLGANIDPGKHQSIQSTLTQVFNALMADHLRNYTGAATCAAFGPLGATASNITINKGGITGITDDDVAITVPGSFLAQGGTNFYSETFKQLLNVLRENTRDM